MFSRKSLITFLLILLCPLSLNIFLEASPQNSPLDTIPPSGQFQQSVIPQPEYQTKTETLPPLKKSEKITWGFRMARKHPFL